MGWDKIRRLTGRNSWETHSQRNAFLRGQGGRSGSSDSGHRSYKRLTQLGSVLRHGQVRDKSHRQREEARTKRNTRPAGAPPLLFRVKATWRIPPTGMMPITVLAMLMPWGLNRRPSVHSERPDGARGALRTGSGPSLGVQVSKVRGHLLRQLKIVISPLQEDCQAGR